MALNLDIRGNPNDIFLHFTRRMGTWWPKRYSWSGETLQGMTIASEAGGFCTEFGPYGFRCDFGRVLEIDPPRHVVFAWQIGPSREPVPDPSRASQVDVTFVKVAGGTRVTLNHTGFSNHGVGAEQYREAMLSKEGWPFILQRFAEACTEKGLDRRELRS